MAEKNASGSTALTEPQLVTWFFYPFQLRAQGWMSEGSLGASEMCLPSGNVIGVYRLTPAEVDTFRLYLPEHDPLDPPWHLMGDRLLRLGLRTDVEFIEASELIEFLKFLWPRTNRTPATSICGADGRWGIPQMSPGACGAFGELVISQFQSAHQAVAADRLGPLGSSRVVNVLRDWPSDETIQRMYVAARHEDNSLTDVLRSLKSEVLALKKSAESYSKWFTGKVDDSDVNSCPVDLLMQFWDLLPIQSVRTESLEIVPEESGSSVSIPELKTRKFTEGVIVFFEDRVVLCGVEICSGSRSKYFREVLDLLRLVREDGSFVPYSSDALVEKLGLTKKQIPSSIIRNLRLRIQKSFLRAGIEVGSDDVILSGGPGYRFTEKLTVQDSGGVHGNIHRKVDVTNVTNSDVTDVTNESVTDVSDGNASTRQDWILAHLATGRRLNASNVKDHFKCSKRTAIRDFDALKKAGKIHFAGNRKTGYYRPGPKPRS